MNELSVYWYDKDESDTPHPQALLQCSCLRAPICYELGSKEDCFARQKYLIKTSEDYFNWW